MRMLGQSSNLNYLGEENGALLLKEEPQKPQGLHEAPEEPTEVTFTVLGAVKNPGRVTLRTGATILNALAATGNATIGDLSKVKVTHKSGAEKPDITEINVNQILDGTSQNFLLRDGDIINVPATPPAVH